MQYLKNQLVIVTSLSVLVGCTSPGEPTDAPARRHGDCILESSIRGYSVLDEQNLIVEASGRRTYHVTLRRRAFGLRSSWGIGFKSRSSSICAGFDEVVLSSGFAESAETVRIASIRQITPEEKEDLLIQYGHKEPDIELTPEPQEVEGADVEELDTAASE